MIENLSLRGLQLECARALQTMQATNNNIHQFNKKAHHNSQDWYKAVVEWYINSYGGLPSKVGPGTKIKLIMDSEELKISLLSIKNVITKFL